MKPEKRKEYELSLKYHRDWVNTMTTAIDTAEAKGRDKEKIAIAKISISQGLDNKTISTITELSIDEIAKLRL